MSYKNHYSFVYQVSNKINNHKFYYLNNLRNPNHTLVTEPIVTFVDEL